MKIIKRHAYISVMLNTCLFQLQLVTGCVSISPFASLVWVLVGTMSSAVELKIAIIPGIKKYNSVIKKKKKNTHDKIVLPVKTKLDTIEVLISRTFIDSYISYDEFVSENNVLRECNNMKKEMKNPETSVQYIISIWLI